MKKVFLFFCYCLIPIYTSAGQDIAKKLAGKWYLNNTDTLFGGQMVISDCTDSKCNFNIQSWYDSHTCDAEGELIIQDGFAEYKTTKYVYDSKNDKEYFIPVGIQFWLSSQDNLNLNYINTDSYNAFCGMNATVEGSWVKQ